jgi:hypothetical protein
MWLELSIKAPYLNPVFGPAFTPYPLFQWYPQSKEILLNGAWNAETQHLMYKVQE